MHAPSFLSFYLNQLIYKSSKQGVLVRNRINLCAYIIKYIKSTTEEKPGNLDLPDKINLMFKSTLIESCKKYRVTHK